MPPLETLDRTADAVLWEKVGTDEYGRPTVSDESDQIKVRWNIGRTESVDSNGTPIALDGDVVVDRQIAVGSVMALGLKEDWDELGTGLAQEHDLGDIYEVMDYKETKDLKGRHIRRTVRLKRYRDTLPTQEAED